MTLILAIAMIINCVSAVKSGFDFITARDQFLKSNQKDYPPELIKARKNFFSKLIFLLVITILLIFDL